MQAGRPFDWSAYWSTLGDLIAPCPEIPFPYAALAVAALEPIQGGGLLATTQFVELDNGRLPGRPKLVPMSTLMTDPFRTQLARMFTQCFGDGNYGVEVQDVSLIVAAGAPHRVGHRMASALQLGGQKLNPHALDAQSQHVRWLFWSHEPPTFYSPALGDPSNPAAQISPQESGLFRRPF